MRYFLLLLSSSFLLHASADGNRPLGNQSLPLTENKKKAEDQKKLPTWQALMHNYHEKYKKADEDLKVCMKEQMLSDLVYASFDPNRQSETKMFIEIMHAHMNANNSSHLSKEAICAVLEKFAQQKADAVSNAEQIRDAMTITDPELNSTKEALKKIEFTVLLNDAFEKAISPHFVACQDVPCSATPQELKEKVIAGEITESQIVSCMHRHTLAKLLAFCLLQTHQF